MPQHFNRMRSRPSRLPPSVDPLSDDEDEHNQPIRRGVQDFNSPDIDFPLDSYELQHTSLLDENNYRCPHCNSVLWKEERANRYNCCKNGKAAIHPLQPVPSGIMRMFQDPKFQALQRRYNGLFSFTAYRVILEIQHCLKALRYFHCDTPATIMTFSCKH